MNEDLKKEFEEKLGKLTLLEDKMESYYTVVNPNALWSWIQTAISKAREDVMKLVSEELYTNGAITIDGLNRINKKLLTQKK